MSTERGFSTRPQSADRFESGDVVRRFGIVTGRVVDLADLLDCTPSDLLDAVRRSGVDPPVDTVRDGEARYSPPIDSELRCLAFTVSDFRELAAIVGVREATEGEAVPAEIR